MIHPLSLPLVLLALAAFLLGAACAASPEAQAALDLIREQRDAAAQEATDARTELHAAGQRVLDLEEILADQTSGTAEERAAWAAELAALVQTIGALGEKIDLLERVDRNLEDSERAVKAKDAGSQVSLWAQILGTVLGGGALGKLLGRFGPSRGSTELGKVQIELAALQAALRAFEATPSRASGQVSEIREKLGMLEGMLAAFKGGLERPLVPPPPGPYPGPGDTVPGPAPPV